jgi:hypothetical protein
MSRFQSAPNDNTKQCGVPDYLIGKMVTRRADSMYWFTTQDLFAMSVRVSQNERRKRQCGKRLLKRNPS